MFAPSLNLDLEKLKEEEGKEEKPRRRVAAKGSRAARAKKPAKGKK